ncbi:LysR family transcriptional regulator [Pseudomonas sp. JQ170]|uniref:LysR family transcriptional regulator n=1 Tax=unclassified Pseudomonas TaxID=196821 RepID=UPI00264BB64D|nr:MULTISPECIES: LysR family transcriptional regulator [unclassified Pseudomonas]MDN7144206.1 LysR family transcriptional regulator [Pseudomonas sp. JQ170]WRO73836.1 LysR family transcriptional regulator [Pseudomonas sp. 170C]
MDVVQLKTLIHVAELGSLSKAADRLHIAQPALSRQIRQLEQELGGYLFERHGRGMQITEMGREVLAHATRIMEEMESIRSTVAGGGSLFRGTVVVGTTPTVAEIATVPWVRKMREVQPHLGIRFSSAYSGYLLDWLQRGELELAISYDPPPLHTLRIVPVMMENLILVGPADAGLRLDTPVAFAQLQARELVLPSARHGLRLIVDECARKAGITLRTSLEADSFTAMVDLVRNGFGLTVLPLASIYSQLQNGSLSAAPLVDPTPMRTLVQVFPADRRVSPAAKFVAQAFTDIAADLIERQVWAGHML